MTGDPAGRACRPRVVVFLPAGAVMPVLLLIVFIDMVGFGIVIPLLPFYAEHFGASPLAVTSLMAIYSLMQFVTAPLLGSISDRFGRRRVLLFSLVGAACGYGLMAMAESLLVLFLARGFAGAMAGNIAAAQAYIADITTPETRARGMGMFGAAFGLGFIVGPSIGGILAGGDAGAVNFALPLLVAAGTSVLAALLVFIALSEPAKAQPTMRSAFTAQSWFGSIAGALRQPGLAGLVVVFFFVVFAFSGLESTFALWAERQLAWGPRDVGYMFAGLGVVLVVVQGGLIGPMTKRMGEERVLFTGVIALVIGFLLLPVMQTPAAAAGAMVLLAAGFGLANPSLQSLVSRSAPATGQGAALGVAQSAASLGRILGPMQAGALFNFGGRALPYFVSAAILIAVAGAVWRRARQIPVSRNSADRS